MKTIILLTASFAALALGGCGKKDEAAGDPSFAASDTMATASQAPAASPAQTFANAAAASDAFEIEASKLVTTKSPSVPIKSFAANMTKAHTESTAKLQTAAAAASVTPVAQITPAQQQVLDELGSKSGDDFDAAYAKAQVDAHQMTLDMLKAYAANGDAPSLKAFANELTPIVTAHLNMAKGL
jgi:putative membrane protein